MPPTPAAVIATDRLDLVPLRVEDAEEMVAVLADPALYAFTGGEPPDRALLAERYRWQVAGASADGREAWCNWIVRVRADDTAVGYVQATIVDDGRSADIAWVTGAPWQGRGYAGEAAGAVVAWLRSLGVADITAHIHPDHGASAGVAAWIGLTQTAELEEGERVWRSAAGDHPVNAAAPRRGSVRRRWTPPTG